jgi:type II secretory pathway component PulM
MKAWFFGLAVRERWIVSVGVAVAAAIILWGFVVRPLRAEVTALRSAVDTKQRLIVDVARIEIAQPSSVVSNRQGADQTLVVIVTNTAGTYGLGNPRTRQNGPSGLDVTLQGVPFDAVMAWLVALHDNYGVDVESTSLSNAREPGLVNGQVSLHRL